MAENISLESQEKKITALQDSQQTIILQLSSLNNSIHQLNSLSTNVRQLQQELVTLKTSITLKRPRLTNDNSSETSNIEMFEEQGSHFWSYECVIDLYFWLGFFFLYVGVSVIQINTFILLLDEVREQVGYPKRVYSSKWPIRGKTDLSTKKWTYLQIVRLIL